MATRRKAESNGEAVRETKEETERLRENRKLAKAETDRQQRRRDYMRWGVVAVVLVLAAIGIYYYTTHYQVDIQAQRLERSPTKSSGATKPTNSRTENSRETETAEAGRQGGGKSDGASKEKKSSKSSTTPSKEGGSEKSKTKGSKAKGDKSKDSKAKDPKAKPTKTKPSKKDGAKGKAPKAKPSAQPAEEAHKYGKREGNTLREEVNLGEIRVLRRPVGPTDSDRPYIIEILMGDNLLQEKRWSDALEKFNEVIKMFPQSPRALYGKAVALENLSKQKKSNKLMDTAIEFYVEAGLESFLAPQDLKVQALLQLVEAAQSRGRISLVIKALEEVQAVAAKNDAYALPSYTNRLGLAYLSSGQLSAAKKVFEGVIENHNNNPFALAHNGFILFSEKKYEEALPMILEGIRKDESIRSNAKFYLYAGECLTRLNRTEEAFALYGEAVALDLLPSLWQRSLYNEPGLRAQPWWTREETGYDGQLGVIETAASSIRGDALSLLDEEAGVFSGDSAHYILFSKGKKMAENCRNMPRTCSVLESFPEAVSCKRGSVQLSALPLGTHILPHTAPSNTKLRAVVGVSGGGVRIRVAEETRLLQEGDIVILDDSFETELWHKGSKVAVILSIDMWHPDLHRDQWNRLGPI